MPRAGALRRIVPGAQMVPIVEPEVLMDGDHDIDRCHEMSQRVLNKTFQELRIQRVALEGMVLNPTWSFRARRVRSSLR